MDQIRKFFREHALLGTFAIVFSLANMAGVTMPTVTSEVTTVDETLINTTRVSLGDVTLTTSSSRPVNNNQATVESPEETPDVELQVGYWYSILTEHMTTYGTTCDISDQERLVAMVKKFRSKLQRYIDERRVLPDFDNVFSAHVIGEIKSMDKKVHKCIKQGKETPDDDDGQARRHRINRLIRVSQCLKTYVRQCTNQTVPGEYVPNGVRPVVIRTQALSIVLKLAGMTVQQENSLNKRALNRLVTYLNAGLQHSANLVGSEGAYKTQVSNLNQLLEVIAGKFSDLYEQHNPPVDPHDRLYRTTQNQLPCFVKWFMDMFGPSKVPLAFSGDGLTWLHRLVQEVNKKVSKWSEYTRAVAVTSNNGRQSTIKISVEKLEEFLAL